MKNKHRGADDVIRDLGAEFSKSIERIEKICRDENQILDREKFKTAVSVLKFQTALMAFGVLCQTIEDGTVVIATAILNNKDEETGK